MVNVSSTIDSIIEKFNPVRRNGRGFIARCPAHEDASPSLTINYGTEGLLVTCWAGCPFRDIAAAIGVPPRFFFYSSYDQPAPSSRDEFSMRWHHLVRRNDLFDLERFDDLLWRAYPYDLERFTRTGVEYPDTMALDIDTALQRWVTTADGAVYRYLAPYVQGNWSSAKQQIFRTLIGTSRHSHEVAPR